MDHLICLNKAKAKQFVIFELGEETFGVLQKMRGLVVSASAS